MWNLYSRVLVMVQFCFFCSSVATLVPPSLLCSNCLSFLLNILGAIYQELFFMSILKKLPNLKKKYAVEFFWERRWFAASKYAEVGFHDQWLPWNHWYHYLRCVWKLILYGILTNNWQILVESFYDFSKHGLHIVKSVAISNEKAFHLLCIFYHHNLVTLYVFT